MGLLQAALAGLAVSVVGWEDVIHVGTRPEISPDEMLTHKKYKAAGLPSPLTTEQLAELSRRRDIARKLAQSNIPEWRQSMISVLTAMDNLEDAITTAAYFSRVAQCFYPPLAPLTLLLQGMSMSIDLVQALDPSRMAMAALKNSTRQLVDRSPGAKNGKTGPQKPGAGKPLSWTKVIPWKYRKPLLKIAPFLPTLGEALEIAQTTDYLFGVGLSLGPIFGKMEETAFTKYKEANQIYEEFIGCPGVMDGQYVYAQKMSPTKIVPAVPIHIYRRALLSMPLLGAIFDVGTQEDAIRTLVGILVTAQAVTEDLYTVNLDDKYLEKITHGIQAPRPTSPLTILAVEEAGCDPYQGGRWPLPGGPEYASVVDLNALATVNEQAIRRRMSRVDPYSKTAMFMGAAEIAATQSLWELSISTLDELTWQDNSVGYAAMRLAHFGLYPPHGADYRPWLAALAEMTHLHEDLGVPWSSKKLKQILTKHGAQWNRV